MKKYIVTIDKDPKNFYANTLEDLHITAISLKDAIKKGRKLSRDFRSKFVRAKKQPVF